MTRPISRPAAHAGSFYPRDPDRLSRVVVALFAEATTTRATEAAGATDPGFAGLPIGLLVPHAGLEYSGPVAARGWARLRYADVASVVIAGTNHFAGWFEGVGVWAGGAWQSPLGEVPIDDELSRTIGELGPPFAETIDAHLEEHSIEVQLPLLARASPRSRIVPLLVSLRDPADCREAGRRLGRLLAERRAAGATTVLVASSDLAHYPSESRAHEVDRLVLEPILALDPWELARREAELRGRRLPGLACGLCGLEPVLFTLGAVREMGATRGVLLAHATSADIPGGDPGRVVGYASVAFVA